MEIVRNYVHRTYGKIGHVLLQAPHEGWMLDGKPLESTTVEHLLTFSLQTLQDAYAGSENLTEAQADFAKKLDKLLAGTIGTRGGAGVDPLTSECRIIARRLFKSGKIKSVGGATFAQVKTDPDALVACLDKIVAINAERALGEAFPAGEIVKQATAEMKRKAAERKKLESVALEGVEV